jgi:hypothetical protein
MATPESEPSYPSSGERHLGNERLADRERQIDIDDQVLRRARLAVHDGDYPGDYAPPDEYDDALAPTVADHERVRALFEEFAGDT